MSYIGVQPTAGQYRKLDDISASFNGSTTSFTTSVGGTNVTAGTAQQLLVSVGGVIQEPDADYTISTNTITFTTAPASGLDFFAILMGDALNTVSTSDGSITTAKLAGSLSVGLAAGTNSAPSLYFTGDSNTGVYSPGSDQVAITTGGTGRLFIDSSGRLLVGTSTARSNFFGTTLSSLTQTEGTGGSTARGALSVINNDVSNNPAYVLLGRSGAATLGSNAAVVSGSRLGTLTFHGADGTSFIEAATVAGEVDGTPGTTDMPGRLVFSTTADGAASPTERLRITSAGLVGIGSNNPQSLLHLETDGTALRIVRGSAIGFAYNTGTASTDAFRIQSNGGSVDLFSAASQPITFSAGTTEKARIDSSGRLLVGTSSARSNFFGASYASALQVETASANSPNGLSIGANTNDDNPANLYLFKTRGTSVGSNTVVQSGDVIGSLNFIGADGTNVSSPAAWIRCAVDGTPGVGDMPGRLVFSTTKDGQSSPTERMRIINDGSILIQQTALSSASDGCYFNAGTPANFHQLLCHSSSTSTLANLYLNRQASDGTLIDFRQADTSEGVISVSGTTVSLVGGHIARWSQLPNNGDPSELLKGTVMSNLDEMCEWGEEDNEQLNKSKVSDVEGDPHVAGVFVSTAFSDEGPLDFYLAMTGDMIIRIAEGVTVQRGDLLMSAGDGTAKPQDDDIVRSKTVAKVTSTHVTCTYDDGSYCVPCVLMAC